MPSGRGLRATSAERAARVAREQRRQNAAAAVVLREPAADEQPETVGFKPASDWAASVAATIDAANAVGRRAGAVVARLYRARRTDPWSTQRAAVG